MKKYRIEYKTENVWSIDLYRKPTNEEIKIFETESIDKLPDDLIDWSTQNIINSESLFCKLVVDEIIENTDNCPRCGENNFVDVPQWGKKICKKCQEIY